MVPDTRRNKQWQAISHCCGRTAALPVPAASTLDETLRHPEHRDAVPFLVDVEPPAKVVRVNITLDAKILQQIDAYTEKIGTSRSAFLANAALYQLGQARPAKRMRRAS